MTNPYPFLHAITVSGSKLVLDSHAIRSISQTLGHVEKGNLTNVLRTPFMKGHTEQEIVSSLDDVILDKIKDDLEVELTDLELSMRSKIGPRSLAKPWLDRRSDVLGYFNFPWPNINPVMLAGQQSFAASLRPLSKESVLPYIINNTSSGLPYMRQKGSIKEEAVSRLEYLLSQKYPAMLFTRTQEAMKTRTVWGIPIGDVINEQRFYRPLLSVMSRVAWRAALRGPDAVNAGISRIIADATHNGKSLVSIDFSSYDQSVGPALSAAAFMFISKLFQPGVRDELLQIAQRFATIPLITPDGVMGCNDPSHPELAFGLLHHGVPSGSSFTNEVDSIVQHLIAMKSKSLDDATLSQIQGDDGAYSTSEPELLKGTFLEYGLKVNDSKSYVSKRHLIYLQNYFSSGYVKSGLTVGIYPIYRALGRLIYLETWTDLEELGISGKDYFAIRAISIMENCKHHPLFRQFVEFVARNDSTGLKFSDNGLIAYVRAIESKGSQEVRNQHGDFVKGIKSFEAFKILSKL